MGCPQGVTPGPPGVCLTPQFSLLTGLGSLGLMIWLTATPHSRETEQKRLGMLAGFAFLTGRWGPGSTPNLRNLGGGTTRGLGGPKIAPLPLPGVRNQGGGEERPEILTPCSALPGINLGPLLQMCIAINPR